MSKDALGFLMTREIAHQKSFEKALYAIEPVHNLILSTSSCISRSLVRSYSLVVRGVRGHFLGVLKRSPIGEVGGDPGGAERVTADFRRGAGRGGAPADHGQASGWLWDNVLP